MVLLLNGPVQGVQSKDTQFTFEGTVGTAVEEELHQFGNVLAKDRYFLSRNMRRSIPSKIKGRTRIRRVSKTSNSCLAPASLPASTA